MRRFSKYHGSGNDFILLDDFSKTFSEQLASQLCDRRTGIGADGLILARPSIIADAKMVFFNADGSRPALCGNGLRCFVHFLKDRGLLKSLYQIEVDEKVLTVKWEGSKIFTYLPFPEIMHWKIPIQNYTVYVARCGVPHAVLFPDGPVDVEKVGREIRFHPLFSPEGVNVNFCYVKGSHLLYNRTYERGVEKETGACGTGICVSAFVANRLGLFDKEGVVQAESKEELTIRLSEHAELSGSSVKVFEGEFAQ